MSEENINEKVDIDGRTRAYRQTVMRLENARKLREQKKTSSVKENKFNGIYQDGTGRGAIMPDPVDFTFEEAMKMIEKYKNIRDKKKTLMGGTKKEEVEVEKDPKGYTYGGGFSKVAKDARIKEDVETQEEELSAEQKKYRDFFEKALRKFGATSPAKMSDDEKKKFFDYVDKNWKG